ncbi:hypothetical protein pdam_00024279, partial [Pocillopora damicornis]
MAHSEVGTATSSKEEQKEQKLIDVMFLCDEWKSSKEVPQLWAPRRVGDWVDRIKHGGRLGEQRSDTSSRKDDVMMKLFNVVFVLQ